MTAHSRADAEEEREPVTSSFATTSTDTAMSRSPLRGMLGSAPLGLMVLAVAVGAGAGAGSIVFRWCIETFTRFFSGHTDYASDPGSPHPHLA